ncbi:MAG: hypothetical protein V9G14_00510 [Cypionkella sp.]
MRSCFQALLAWGLSLGIHMGSVSPAQAEEASWEKYPRFSASIESGFLAVLDHKIQFSRNNTYFDYLRQGGQDTLFAVNKFSLDLQLNPQHTLVFLYQPLSLTSQSVLAQDITQDNISFAKGTAMKYLYDFPFFRGSYLYDFNPDPFEELAVGASLQLRDAVIEFESLDGKQLVSKRNIGPVPILKFRSRHRLGEHFGMPAKLTVFMRLSVISMAVPMR